MITDIARAAFVALLLCAAAGAAETVSSTVSVQGPSSSPSLLALQSKAALTGGTLRVVVLLREGASRPASASAFGDDQTIAVSRATRDAVARRAFGGTSRIVSRVEFVPMFVADATPAELAKLAADPQVQSISEDHVLRPMLRDSTKIIGMSGPSGAFAKGATGQGRAVAILDTGINRTHEFVRGRVIYEACFNTNDPARGATSRCPGGGAMATGPGSAADCAASLADGCGHGTHVAGIAAGRNPTVTASQPVRGVAPVAGIVAINVFSRFSKSACGGEERCVSAYFSDVIAGLDRVYSLRKGVANRRIDAVNLSLGSGETFAGYCDNNIDWGGPALAKAIERLRSAGIAVVVASGNSYAGNGVSFPACIKAVTTVGASTKRASGKRERVALYSNSGRQVDLLAPGGDSGYPFKGSRGGILSSMFKGYAHLQGTSMAAPHVAGAFAAMRSAKGCSTKSVLAIEKALKSTGSSIRDQRSDCTTACAHLSKPRINVSRALTALGCGR